jgi:hypothetical protein
LTPGSTDSRVKGWWVISAHDCSVIGTVPAGWIDLYADTDDASRVWDGMYTEHNVKTCLSYPGAFDYANYGGYVCASNQKLKIMASYHVSPGRWTYNLD